MTTVVCVKCGKVYEGNGTQAEVADQNELATIVMPEGDNLYACNTGEGVAWAQAVMTATATGERNTTREVRND